MDGEAIKQRLWDLGHFRNPERPTGVEEGDLAGLSLTNEAVKTAIRSYQDFMREDFDRISIEEHSRPGKADGEVGPATMRLFAVQRCGCPDYGPDVELAVGRGSWPAGCTKEYPDNHTFVIYWDKRNMPGFLSGVIDRCIELCYAAYRDMGIVFITSPDSSRCNTVASWERGRGWIGLAIVGQNQRCNTKIWAKYDTRYQPRNMVDQWARLLAHEFGHNMGLRHSRGGVMNPSISSGPFTRRAWRGDPSESILRRWFGGEPVPPRDQPDPEPPPNDDDQPPVDGLKFRGEFEAVKDGKSLGKFILIPKPEV